MNASYLSLLNVIKQAESNVCYFYKNWDAVSPFKLSIVNG